MAYIPMSYFVAFGVSMLIEYPMVSLEKLFAAKVARADNKVSRYNLSSALSPGKPYNQMPSYHQTVFDNHLHHENNKNQTCDNNHVHSDHNNQVRSVFNHISKLPSIERVKAVVKSPPPRVGTVSQVISFDREEEM